MKPERQLEESDYPDSTKTEKSLLEKAIELLELDPLAFCENILTLIFDNCPEDIILEAVEIVCGKREMALSVIKMMSPVKKPEPLKESANNMNDLFEEICKIVKPADKFNNGYYRPQQEKIIS